MCTYSMVFDRYKPWPGIIESPPFKPLVPEDFKDAVEKQLRRISLSDQKTAVQLFKELTRIAKQLDNVLGLTDCESAEKMEWFEKVKNAILDAERAKLEKELSL